MTSVTQKTATATIRFTATLDSIDESTVMRLPEEASRLLPSRGQVAVRGSMNGHEFRTVLEPDGVRGHWIRIDPALRQAAHIGRGRHRQRHRAGDTRLAGAGHATRPGRSFGGRAAGDQRHLERHHADGALGMGALGQRDRKSRDPPAACRGDHLQN